jgi:XTP/dITP diphosphohydrolase
MTRKFLIATTNAGKAREIARLFAGLPVRCVHLGEIDRDGEIPEAVEDGDTFEDNARIKAVHYAKATGLPTMAEDAGLEIPILDCWPGVMSARIAETDSERVALVLEKMKGKAGEEREARFVSVAAFYDPETDELETFEGIVQGTLLEEPRGENGFGYDPIFWHPGFGKTLAELTTEEKNLISHRGQSVRALARWLKWSGWPMEELP